MEVLIFDDDLSVKFCGGGVCDGNFSCELPLFLRGANMGGTWEVYICKKNRGWADCCNCVFVGDTALIYPRGEIAQTHSKMAKSDCSETHYQPTKSEYIASARHVVFSHGGETSQKSGVEVFCQNGGYSLENCNLKSSDCVNIRGGDYIILQFESYITVLFFDGVEYIASEKIPATTFQISNGEVKIELKNQTSCHITFDGSFPLEYPQSNIFSGSCEAYNSASTAFLENYTAETFPPFFFEVLFLAKYLSPQLKTKMLSKYLSQELCQSVEDIVEFIGDFCGIIPAPDGMILLYQTENSMYETRKFQLETQSDGSFFKVTNIKQSEEVILPSYIPKEFSKVVWLLW
ncbi:MAG: hypothetical protein R3Y32_04330 [Bacillota bacterium]